MNEAQIGNGISFVDDSCIFISRMWSADSQFVCAKKTFVMWFM